MPGPISDSYDPEWGTAANGELIAAALTDVYGKVSKILIDQPPLYILDLVKRTDMAEPIQADLTTKEWRLLRFALERARDSL